MLIKKNLEQVQFGIGVNLSKEIFQYLIPCKNLKKLRRIINDKDNDGYDHIKIDINMMIVLTRINNLETSLAFVNLTELSIWESYFNGITLNEVTLKLV